MTHICSESNSTLGSLLATKEVRGLMTLLLSSLGWLSPFNGPDHQLSSWLCLMPLSFLSRSGLFLLFALGFLSVNKLSLLKLFVLTSSADTLASKPYSFWSLLSLRSTVLCQSSYYCCHCTINIESYFFLEYSFNSIFPLKVSWARLVFCLLTGLDWAMDTTFTLGVVTCLSMYSVRKATTAS